MAPQMKLSYFNARGVAEPIRMILAFAKIDYEDFRFEKENWPELKDSMPWGQVPVLEVDGTKIAQSKAIARYLAKKYDMVGETDLDAAKCDEYIDVLDDIRSESLKWFHETNEEKRVIVKTKLEVEVLPRYLSKFTAILKRNGTGFLVSSKVTYADIYLANMVDQLGTHFSSVDIKKFPELQQHSESILGQPGIKEWIASRPQTAF